MNKFRIEILYFDGNLKGATYCDNVRREDDYLLLSRNEGKDCEILSLRQGYRFRICEVEQ